MSVGAVNNNNQQGTYAIVGGGAGLATGAIAGGTYGYLSKPWLKDGDITDTFIKEADKHITNMYKDTNKQIYNDLKKMLETGSIDGVSEPFKETFKDVDLEKMTAEQRKGFVKNLLKDKMVENLDELLKRVNRVTDKASIMAREKYAEMFKSVTDNSTVEELNKLIKDKNLEEVFGVVTEADRTSTIEIMKSFGEDVTLLKNERKASILEHVDVKEKSMKKLASDADYETKSIYNAIKKSIKNMNLKAAAKWGAIGAGVLGVIGLSVGAMNKKS